MNSLMLINLLKAAALAQISIAVLNLFLTRLLKWKGELLQMPLLLREVFHVHAWFISVTLAIFGVITWRFSNEMASGSQVMAQWLAMTVGLFWAFRTVLQVCYYSSSHWRGQILRTAIHVTLLLMYGGMAGVYLYSSLGGTR
jgi:hypothetical protein